MLPERPTLGAWFQGNNTAAHRAGSLSPPPPASSADAAMTVNNGITMVTNLAVNDSSDSDTDLEENAREHKRQLSDSGTKEDLDEVPKRMKTVPVSARSFPNCDKSATPRALPATGDHTFGPGAASSSSSDLTALQQECEWLRRTVEDHAKTVAEKEAQAITRQREDMQKFEAMLNQRMDEKLQQHTEENRIHLSAMMEEKLKLTFDASAAHTSAVVQSSQKEITAELTNTMQNLLGGFMSKLDGKTREKKRATKSTKAKDEDMSPSPSSSDSDGSDGQRSSQQRGQKRTKGGK